MARISFDFDDTLLLSRFDEDWGSAEVGPNEAMVKRFRELVAEGHEILIVTTRFEKFSDRVFEFLEEHDLPASEVHFTNGKDKAETLIQLGVVLHHDDDPVELDLLPDTIQGVLAPCHESWNTK